MKEDYPKPVVLISMDGVGSAPPGPGNALTQANTPNLDKYWPLYPHGMLEAAGLYVGLPEGTDGNSEVGHVTMGAGKIILQDLPRIDNAVANKSFFDNVMLKKAFEHAEQNKGSVHFMGITGHGLVHGSLEHLFALIELAAQLKFNPDKVFIHCFLDGRDSPTDDGVNVLEEIQAKCLQKRTGIIASMVGRAIAMDRNKNWKRTQKAYDMLTQGKGKVISDWKKELTQQYKNKVSDEYTEPTLIVEGNSKPHIIQSGDSVIMFNFRPDRAQQITRAFEDENFPGWQREMISNLFYTGFTDYKNGFPKNIAFPAEEVTDPLGKIISENGLKQLRLAESEKFPHVTYFFNGGTGKVFENEKWIEVPSPKVATYDQKPEMSQRWLTDVLLEKMQTDEFDFILINYAGPDMVAHTGNIKAAITAMEVCDECVGRVIEATLAKNGAVVITADHGNIEEMIDVQTGKNDTKHSVNQVPVMIIQKGLSPRELPVGNLADIAPTILSLYGIEIPPAMTGRNLLI
ncbi:2,3-bisphosphoglycerate-independent phosphoglycerate mutase [Candidatus Dojkabacteria bacterium]|uniref:2,3-bisphosphoglycerate-independent phosphoglycerate mutase n=1 Tax=Candidatus Dojkabacteria bacterium TaxID=2099670 RepID=A0A955IAV7_9BACT|nr:2,3-bisphosphoglycerate-independent phosphoglycerate mutase [Candidatus Dojkabacteria bacterium]